MHYRRRQRRREVRTQALDLAHVGAERLGDVRESCPGTFGQDFRGLIRRRGDRRPGPRPSPPRAPPRRAPRVAPVPARREGLYL